MAVIALSIEPFAADRTLAATIAEALGVAYVDLQPFERELADQIGSATTTDGLRFADNAAAARWYPAPTDLAARVRELILETALRKRVLIASWCAPLVLRGFQHTMTAFVRASDDVRAKRVQQLLCYPMRETAHYELHSEDAAIGGLVRGIFGANWRDLGSFDLIVDAERLAPAACAAVIRAAIRHTPCQAGIAGRRSITAHLDALLR